MLWKWFHAPSRPLFPPTKRWTWPQGSCCPLLPESSTLSTERSSLVEFGTDDVLVRIFPCCGGFRQVRFIVSTTASFTYDLSASPAQARYDAYRSEISARSLSESPLRYSVLSIAPRVTLNNAPARLCFPKRAYSNASLDVVMRYAMSRDHFRSRRCNSP